MEIDVQDTDCPASRLHPHCDKTGAGVSGDIERELRQLGRSLPGMHARHPVDADFWVSFKACAGMIGSRARNDSELRHVQMRLVLMLSETPRDHGDAA